MSEFVPLSEERIREVAEDIANDHEPAAFYDAVSQAERWARKVASESSANTRRWLMEKVCDECGATRGKHLEHHGGDEFATIACGSDWITRAEYLSRTEPR